MLADVMDVICQCMEVRSSTEGSEESNLSQLSACSFKKESIRRSSISDVSPSASNVAYLVKQDG